MSRVIGIRVFFAWDFASYTDESTNVVRVSGESRFAPPEAAVTASQGIVDRCTIELRNVSGRLSALNASGALYNSIRDGKAYHVPVYVDTTLNANAGSPTWTRVFTGVAKIPKEKARVWDGLPTVTFECRSRDELLLQARRSTTQADFKARVDAPLTEAGLIQEYLDDLGVDPAGYALDPGLFSIQWAWLDDESPLEDIWQLAAAAGGRFYADHEGVLRYENAAHWLNAPHLTSQQTYTNADWQSLEAYYEDRELYSRVTVEYASRQIDDEAIIWQPDEVVQIPAGGSRTIWATFSYPAYTEPVITWKAATTGGTEVTSGVTITATWYAQRAKLEIANSSGKPVVIFPFQIAAQVASGGPTADAEDASVNAFWTAARGERSRSVRGNLYVQSRGQAAALASFLRVRQEVPRLFYRVGGLLGNGARRPGDRITINDASVMSAAREAMVLAVRWQYGAQSYTMDIEAMDAAGLFTFGTTTPGYFKIGTNKLRANAGDADAGRIFY